MEASVHEAKTHLSRLLDNVLMGEEVVITRSGRPIAKLVAFEAQRPKRRVGSAAGLLKVPDNFNDPLPPEEEEPFWS